jgi:hypothetical protein
MLDDFKQLTREMLPLIEANKPHTVFQQAYLNEESTEVTFVHVVPDGEAMDVHLEGADQRTARASEFIQPRRFEIYGKRSDQVLSTLRHAAAPGIDLTVKPEPIAGFLRLTPG